ncbi:EAL domain-containing protein [Erythrobacter sp. GH1-10]|uniref:EAL domain-containing protein n=1 Tax=Erythrobacter sp. GH1-10 TaxID=3349334 RepID=UPI003877D011
MRIRHAIVAIVVAALLAVVTILRPLDVAIWSLQSKLFSKAPSGEIVLVENQSGQYDNSREAINRQLLSALDQLDRDGVDQIVIHSSLQRSGSDEIDRELRAALERNADRIYLSRPVRNDIDENDLVEAGSPYFERGMRIASSDIQPDFLRLVWGIEAIYQDDGRAYPAVWNVLAYRGEGDEAVYPDYTIDTTALKRIDLAELGSLDPDIADAVRGKTVVIGGLLRDRRSLKAPDANDGDVSASLIQVVAAETALRGGGQFFGSLITIPAFGLLLLIGLMRFRGMTNRRRFYAFWICSFGAVFVMSALVGWRIMLAEPMFVAIFFAIARMIYNYRRRHLFIDPRSRLPNFAALRRDLESSDEVDGTAIVVAKIARLDAILASLNQYEQGQYLRQIASRLTLGDAALTVYHDGGKYFSFLLAEVDYPDLQAHLEGLRAVVSQAVTIGKRAIDVSLTVGVDQSDNKAPSSRISSAIAAADQAREAYRPVFIITDFEADSETWDYSLQSRLENALSDNRIWIKLQPQVDLQTGLFVGSEALARWVDEERGEISPARFILQCERVGRLDELTKRVLRLSFEASRSLQDEGLPPRTSVNVSAIQFVDQRIADLVERTLVETDADPSQIFIEITETARFEDFAVARDIMEQIGKSGIRFSIDDFGVASANYDALYNLPFSEVKIDRMFANSVARDKSARAIVSNMLQLARDLGMESVAEGIDNMETFEMLRDMGGDLAQGFCIARPQTFSLFQETMRLQRGSGIQRSSQG